MAEIGLVASIFGVASFGTKVATSLYEAADVMIHAHQQIASMAKHVSQFTAVLRYLGRVLESEKGSCSKDLLREIRKIKRSCKSTFKEINATVTSRQFRSFVPVRWLFKKSKAKELEARLDSEQSMLQVMIHTVTVSKLGDMQSKSKEDSKQLLGIKDEIELLKTLIVENYNNSIELQHAEQRTEVESRGVPSHRVDIRQGSHPSYDSQETLSAGRLDVPNLNYARSRKPPSLAPSLSESDHEDVDPVGTAGSARSTVSHDHVGQEHSESSIDDTDATGIQVSPLKQLSKHNSAVGFGTYRASTSLLQMVPYRPSITHSSQRYRFISVGPDTAPRSAVESATGTVRLLLDKWTTSGSGPVSELLAETDDTQQPAQDTTHENNQAEPDFSRPRTPSRPPFFTNESFDHESDAAFHPPPFGDYPDMRGAHSPPLRSWVPPNTAWELPEGPPHSIAQTRSKDVWKDSPLGGQVSARSVGNDMLKCLRYTHGGIVYTKSNDFQHLYFVDGYEFYRFYLVPSFMIPSKESKIKRTEIGNGWVRREALDLLGYSYSETLSGQFSIPRNLTINEIEELVVFSYQADNRRLAERSRQIVKERGWREKLIAWSREEARMYPKVYPSFHEPWRQPSTTNPQYSGPSVDIGRGLYHSGTREHGRASTSPPELQDLPLPEGLQAANSESQPKGTEGASERKPAVSEVRFTVPRLEPPQQTTRMPPSRRPTFRIPKMNIQRKGQDQELREAMDKLERLKKNLNEAVKTKNYAAKSDLEYYAIPDLESRIETLKQDRKRDESEGKSAPAEKQGRVPVTAVETDSEESEEPESKAADVNGSENGSADQDMYE